MPILLDRSDKIICQGIWSEQDVLCLHQSLAYGMSIVAFVGNEEGDSILGRPVFASVSQACRQTNGNVSLIHTPPEDTADAILEAEDAGISLIVCLTSNIPLHDLVDVRGVLARSGRSLLVGPESFGIITPGHAKVGYMSAYIFLPGVVGIISRSHSLACEAALQIADVGVSTCVGIGDSTKESVQSIITRFDQDRATESILFLGDIPFFDSYTIKKPAFVFRNGKDESILPKIVNIDDVRYIGNSIRSHM